MPLSSSRIALPCLLACLALAAWLAASRAIASDELPPPLSDYYRESWTTRSGLPHNSINAITQTPDGYLWVGTWEGAVRFNGRNFVNFDRERVPGLPDSGIRALSLDSDGSLLLGGGRGGLVRLQGQEWKPYAPAPALISNLYRDSSRRLWVGTESFGALRIDADGERQHYTREDGLPGDSVLSTVEDPQGRVWLGSSGGLVEVLGTRLAAVPGDAGLPSLPILALTITPDARLLVGTERGVFVADTTRPTLRFEPYDTRLAEETATRLLFDRDGQLWIGTVNRGLLRLSARGLERVSSSDGLPNNRVLALHQDREGSLWVGTNGGLFRLSDAPFSSLTETKGLADNFIRTVLEHSDGSLWIGSSRGLDRLQGDTLTRVGADSAGNGQSVLSLTEAANGDVWVGTYTQGALRYRDGRVVRQLQRSDGLAGNEVRAVLEARDGSLWAGTSSGLTRFTGDQARTFTLEDGLPGLYVVSLMQGQRGEIWVGTGTGLAVIEGDSVRRIDLSKVADAEFVFDSYEQPDGSAVWLATDRGLIRYRHSDGQLAGIGRSAGLPFDKIFHVIADNGGGFWLPGNRGVIRIARREAIAVADGRQPTLAYERFTEADGMASAQCNGGSGPSATLRADGSVWIATAVGVAHVQPQRLAQFAETPPPVVIESFRVDDREYPLQQGQRLPAGSQRIELEFAGLSFAMSQRIRYRYRLLGFDANWVERDNQPYAQFTNLEPGNYELRIAAAHPSGRWSEDEAVLRFGIEPQWWQRPEVQIGALLAILLAVGWGIRWRLRSLRDRARQLGELVDSRTTDLRRQTEKLLAMDSERERLLDQLRQKSEAFERQSREDALTGLLNRRAFDEALELEFARAERAGHPLCLAILDLDHFKRVNDNWSHAVGDEALKAVAEVMRKQFRSIDSLARWGGEEFAMLLPYTGPEHARAACERLRAAVAGIDCSPFAKGLKLSVSIGVASQHGVANHDKLLSLADAALYRAKEGGRNQVCAAAP